MADMELLLEQLVSREFTLRFFRTINAPPSFLRQQQSALEAARKGIREIEATYGKIKRQVRQSAYNEYLNGMSDMLTAEQYSAICKTCTHFYMNRGEQREPLPETDDEESKLKQLFEEAEMLQERGCPLHPNKPDEMVPSEECSAYHAIPNSENDYELRQINNKIRILKDLIIEVNRGTKLEWE